MIFPAIIISPLGRVTPWHPPSRLRTAPISVWIIDEWRARLVESLNQPRERECQVWIVLTRFMRFLVDISRHIFSTCKLLAGFPRNVTRKFTGTFTEPYLLGPG